MAHARIRIQPVIKVQTWRAVRRKAKALRMTLNACVDYLLTDALHQLGKEVREEADPNG